mgnify:CR=1 FL=1
MFGKDAPTKIVSCYPKLYRYYNKHIRVLNPLHNTMIYMTLILFYIKIIIILY